MGNDVILTVPHNFRGLLFEGYELVLRLGLELGLGCAQVVSWDG